MRDDLERAAAALTAAGYTLQLGPCDILVTGRSLMSPDDLEEAVSGVVEDAVRGFSLVEAEWWEALGAVRVWAKDEDIEHIFRDHEIAERELAEARAEAGRWTEVVCEKCGRRIRFAAADISVADVEYIGRVVVVGGEPMTCPFHPGMTYYLRPVDYCPAHVPAEFKRRE